MSKIYLDLKICDLREECKKRNLDIGGLKVHLVERLTKYDKDIENAAKELEKKSNEIKVNANGKSDCKDEKTIVDMKNLFKNVNEPENWESRTDVHLDFYSSDLNIVIDPNGSLAGSMFENGFEYMFGGVKANYGVKSGKVFYEIKILKKNNIRLDADVGESSVIKVGWSSSNTSLDLGDEELSYAYEGSGKRLTNCESVDYGLPIKDGDVIGCFLEFFEESFIISFSINGVNQGEAFKTMITELKDHFMVPHIFMRNMIIKSNFGVEDNASFPPIISLQDDKKSEDESWILLGRFDPAQLLRGPIPPPSKACCEVMMMCGLPSCGKTTWVDNIVKINPDKFYNVLSTNAVLEKMKVMSLRKKCSSSRWESFIQSATRCLNKLMEIAVTRRRNFILDQTNVYPAAQRRRMKTFEEFIRKAIIIVPSDDEYQRRMTQVITEEGKDVPESAVLQMKENFVIPEESSDLFNETIFVELQREEAEKLVKKYNDEAKENNKKNNMEHSNGDDSANKREEEEEEEEDISWMKADRVVTDDQPSMKKSRWNDESAEERSSKPKEFGNWSTSSSHSTRRTEHKSESDRGGARSSHKSDDRYSTKDRSRSRDRRDDRYRSGGGSGRDRGDRRERSYGRDRGDDDGGSRRGRSRERGSESRGSYGREDGASRSSVGGGYEDRRRRFESDYSDSGRPREVRSGVSSSRFQTGDNFRGSRFSDASGNEQRGASKYTEFNPYESSNIGSQFKPDRRDYEYKASSDRSGHTGLKSSGGTRATRWGGAIADTNTDNRYGASNYDPDDTNAAYSAYFDSTPQFSDASDLRYQNSAAFPQFHKPPSEETPKYSQPYNNRAVPPSTDHSFYNKSDTTPKFGQPYPIKTATGPNNSMAQFPKPDSTPKYGQPYVSKPIKPTGEHTKFDNPYSAKPGQFGGPTSNKADDYTKYENPYSSKNATKTDSVPPFDNPYKSAMSIPKFAQPYPSKLANASVTPKYDMPSQSIKHGNEYQSYGYDDQNGEYYDEYAGESNADTSQPYSSIGSQLSSLRAASYNTAAAEGAYSAPSRGGAQGTPGIGGVYNAPPSDMYNAPPSRAGGAYNNAPSRTALYTSSSYDNSYESSYDAYNTSQNAMYSTNEPYINPPSSTAGSFKTPQRGGFKNTPSNSDTSGAYTARSGGSYISPSRGAYNATSSSGAAAGGGVAAYKPALGGAAYTSASNLGYASGTSAYNAAPSAGYATPSSAGYATPSSTGCATPSSSGYYTPSSAPYGAAHSGAYSAPHAAAYQAQSNSAYNTPTSSAYYTSPSSAYYTPSNSAYNTPVSGAYYTPPISAYYTPSSSAQRSTYGTEEGAPKAGYNTPSNVKSSNATIATPNVTNASYSNAAHGSYTNTPSGSYGNHNVPKSSTSLATATNATYGSFTNPYSNYYESASATGGGGVGYQYYGQESTHTNKPPGAAPTASDKLAPTSAAQSAVYGDYSQYYAQ